MPTEIAVSPPLRHSERVAGAGEVAAAKHACRATVHTTPRRAAQTEANLGQVVVRTCCAGRV
jgi:hypothetical protein